MWSYLANSLAWSAFGLLLGAVLADLGWDLRSTNRNSGRRNDDR